MNRLKTIIFALLLICAAGVSAAELSLRVVPVTGKSQQEALSAIGKMVYRNDSLLVFDQAGNPLYKEALRNMRRIDFTETDNPGTDVSAVENQKAKLSVYPNPTQGLLQVQHAEGDFVRVYDLQGKQLFATALHNGIATIDVSALPAGTYLLLVQNGLFRFIKE